MQRTSLSKHHHTNKDNDDDTIVTISFSDEKDRIKGVAELMRSPYKFTGIDKNRFLIKKRTSQNL